MRIDHVALRSLALLALLLGAACYRKRMYTTDCGFDSAGAPHGESRATWTATAAPGRLEGHVREMGKTGATVRKAVVLLPQPGSWDTLHVPVDSAGAFHVDGLPPGRRQVIVQARWYWAAFDTVEIRADSGLAGDVQLRATPVGWTPCLHR